MPLEICRICGSSQNSLKHVFSEGNEELIDQIRLCANIQIDALDDLPKYICNVCEQGLAFSYSLRKKGEETENKLRQGLLAVKDEVDEDLIEDVCYDQMWVTCEAEDQLDEEEELVENIEDGEEILEIVAKEEYHMNEDWIIQHEDFVETDEIIENVGIEIVEENLIEPMCTVDLTNEMNENEIEQLEDEIPKKIQIKCETCGEIFHNRLAYCEHVKSHGDKRFHCEICDKWYNYRYRYDHHKKIHSTEQSDFQCPKCNKTYTVQSNLERHIRSAHNGEKRYQCCECGTSFGRPDILKMHMSKHSTERNIECDICQKKFKTIQHVQHHKRCHLEKSERVKKPVGLKPKPKRKPTTQEYECEFCDKISYHRTTHVNHMRTHTGEKPYKCTTCDKAFRTSHARSSHELLHTNERPHQCKVCFQSFRQTSHLKAHMLIHSGVKKHICQYCQKAFTMKSNMRVHMKMHTGGIPYKCDKCPQKFLQIGQFKRHQMSHEVGEDALQKETCSGNKIEFSDDFNDSHINLYVDELESS